MQQHLLSGLGIFFLLFSSICIFFMIAALCLNPLINPCGSSGRTSITHFQYNSTSIPFCTGIIFLIIDAHNGQLQNPCSRRPISRSEHISSFNKQLSHTTRCSQGKNTTAQGLLWHNTHLLT